FELNCASGPQPRADSLWLTSRSFAKVPPHVWHCFQCAPIRAKSIAFAPRIPPTIVSVRGDRLTGVLMNDQRKLLKLAVWAWVLCTSAALLVAREVQAGTPWAGIVPFRQVEAD